MFRRHRSRAAQEEGLGTEQDLEHQRHTGALVRIIGTIIMLAVLAVITLFIQGMIDGGNTPWTQFIVDMHRWLFSKTAPFRFSDL